MRHFSLPLAVLPFVLLTACQMAEAPAPAEAPLGPPLRFGVLPAIDSRAVADDYAPLLAELGKVLHRPVELVIPSSYNSLNDLLLAGKIEIAQLSAHLYASSAAARIRAGAETEVLAQQRLAAGEPHQGLFVAKKDAPVATLQDLAGKAFAYVDIGSSSGYFYPRQKLVTVGIDPDKHFARIVIAGSHERVIELVQKGEVDAGCVSAQSLPQAAGLKIIAHTNPIPDDAIVSLGGLSSVELENVRRFFLDAEKNPTLALFFNRRGIERYVPADVSVYAPPQATP